MRKVRNLFKKAVNLTLVLSLLLSVFSVGAYAATDSDDPVVLGVSMNETRSYITILFDRTVEAATSSFSGKIKLSQEGKSLTSLSSRAKVTISDCYMYITLTSPLSTSDNYFAINAGTLVGQDEVIETPLFDARGPELKEEDHVTLDADTNTVTIKFARGIKGYPNNDSLKNGYISLARSGSSFSEVIPSDDITIDSDDGTISIYLSEWLTGSRARFRIAAGKLQDKNTGNINLDDITTDYIDASETSPTPEIDYIDVDSDFNTITVYFTDRIKNAFSTGVSSTVAENLLKSHIWLARGSSSKYETLGASDDITIGSKYLKIDLDSPLTSSRNYLKIEGSSLTDYYGDYIIEDIVTDNFTSGTATAATKPAYASAFLSSSNKIVIYFTTTVKKNPELTTSELRSRISISRNGDSYETLTSSDSVSFSDNTMTITLREELTGSGNRVKISANTVSSSAGVLLSSSVTTSSLSAGMSDDSSSDYDDGDYPEYSKITYDSSAQRVRIYFERDIRKVSSADLYDDITISRNGGSYQSLSSSDVITISPSNAITILLAEPLTGTRNSFKIAGGTIADYDSGYVQNSSITTDYISASGSTDTSGDSTSDYSGNVSATLSDDLYSVTLRFDEAVYNNKDSLEELKSKIQISRNNSFKALGTDDYIRLDSESKELLIVLAEPADEYYSQIKILSGALRDADGGAISGAITTLPLGEADGEVRAYINDIAVDDIVSGQASGTATIATVSDSSKFNAYSKAIDLLIKVPSASDSATLNVSGSVVELIKRYGGTIALSLGDSTYYLPTSNISSISSSDTLSIAIDDSTSTISQKLASSSTSDSFTIEAPAKKLTAKIVASSGSSNSITHTAFAEKRFMLAEPSSNKTAFTLVRIEASGTVVPVPTGSEVMGGVVYLTAKTLKDGDYAAISASHTLDTLAWVQAPTNALASRLILSNATGTNLNGSEAITRAETVTIMAKTLGIYGDMDGASPFFDMISSDSFFDAVMATVSYDLITGYTDSTFRPSNKLTRAEAMTIVARAMRFMKGKNVSESPDMSLEEASNILSKFSDAGAVGNWAKVNIAECVQAGVVNGDNNGRLNPTANVTRAELIQLMYNVLNNSDML